MKTSEKLISDFAATKGKQSISVLEDLLDYIIGYLNPINSKIEGWKYDKEDNAKFFEMMREYFNALYKRVDSDAWYDAWGELFMSLITKGGNKGQFFTPPSLCDLMAKVSLQNYDNEKEPTQITHFGKRCIISDCSAGSSRNLLAANAIFNHNKWRKPYLVAEDIDSLCCKMSAVNMAVHGCFGEVVCHDTLGEPSELKHGYIINLTMYPFPTNVPSITPCNDANKFFCTKMWRERKADKGEDKTNKEHKQLSLF